MTWQDQDQIDSHASSSELIRRAKSGDLAAYAEATENYRERLQSFVAMIIGDWDEATSIVQESFMRGFQQITSFHEQGNLYSWLRGIAHNLSKQFLDKKRRQASVVDPSKLSEQTAYGTSPKGMLSQLLSKEVNVKLWLAISQLPEAYREAFTLHYVEELDYATISELTGVSAGNLRARALRARNLLKVSLGDVVDTWMKTADSD